MNFDIDLALRLAALEHLPSRVSPCLTQPGRAGTSATKNPSSSCSIRTRYFIGGSCA